MESIVGIVLASLIFPGIINLTRSLASGRKGPGLFQPVRDIIRLFRKGSVVSRTTSLIFQLAPSIQLAALITAMMVIPFGDLPGLFSFSWDFVFFIYLIAIGKFFGILSALDTGSSFAGMGASRDAHFSMMAEPAFFVLMGSLSLLTGKISFHEIFLLIGNGTLYHAGVAVMAGFVLFLFLLIETFRLPIDDPRTHLELTMVHEVMVLDNSGFDLGLILYTGALRFAVFSALIANLFMAGLNIWGSTLLFFVIQILLAVLVGLIESFMARFRMSHNSQFILSLSSIALLIFIGILLVLESA